MSFFNKKKPVENTRPASSQDLSDATFYPEQVIEGRPDSDYAIYGFAQSYQVPHWVPIDSQKNCYHCKENLKSGCTHNCRLCGNLFCSRCTAKYNLPEKFDLKGKIGPARVCYGCRMSNIRMKQASLDLPLDSIQRTLTPPVWQSQSSYIACNKCCVKRRNPHNCRCCGLLYCDDCTTKMGINFPPSFNQKHKTGPQRVCDSCRYRIYAGARLDDGSRQQVAAYLARQQAEKSQAHGASLRLSQELSDDEKAEVEHDPIGVRGPAQSPLARPGTEFLFNKINTAHQQLTQDPNAGIRIVYQNGGHTGTIPVISTRPPMSDVTKELTSVLGKLTVDTNTSSTTTPPPQQHNKAIPLSQLAEDMRKKTQQQTQMLTGDPSVAASPPLTPTTIAEHRQLQRIRSIQSGTGSGRGSVSSSSTNAQQMGNTPSYGAVPNRPSMSIPTLQLDDGELPPPPPPPEDESPQPRHIAGARDPYRHSTSMPLSSYLRPVNTSTPVNAQSKLAEQSLDDAKEQELTQGEDPQLHLVKPSALFNRAQGSHVKQNVHRPTTTNPSQPKYLREENENNIKRQ